MRDSPGSRPFKANVTVLGCGLMGSAIARKLAESGHPVVVWNRTPSKAQALASSNIVAAESVADAVASASVVLVVVANYDQVLEVLSQLEDARPQVIVTLATGHGGDAERAQQWCADHDLAYLDGAIFAYPQQIGRRETALFVSGDKALWSSWSGLFMELGGASRHVAGSIGSANVLDTGVGAALFLSALGAYLESLAYMLDEGVGHDDIVEATAAALPIAAESMYDAVEAAVARNYQTDQATMETMVASIRGCIDTMEGSGHSARSLRAALDMCGAPRSSTDDQAYHSIVEQLRHG